MFDHAAARINMVENQIRTNSVTDERVLDAMSEVPRERFVPKKLQGVAYVDEDLIVAPGRYLIEPLTLARLLQGAAVAPGDIALDIGCATGYSAAVLAKLAATVVAVESDPALVESASTILAELDIDNAVVVSGDLANGYAKHAPYDVIMLGGAVEEVPGSIADQLAEGGRLVAVVTGGSRVGRGTLVWRRRGALSEQVLFDAEVPPLPGFVIERGFVF